MLISRAQAFNKTGYTPPGVKIHSVKIDRASYRMNSSWDELGVFRPESLEQACEKRQAEFLAGRYCAGMALSFLGKDFSAVVETAEDRSPVWPAGSVGSVTHSRNIAAAVVSRSDSYDSLGIDLEFFMSEKTCKTVRDSVSIPAERQAGNRPVELTETEYYTLIFSAKESIYKAIYPLTNEFFGFSEACIFDICSDSGTFSFRLNKNLSEKFCRGFVGKGFFCYLDEFVFTSVFIQNDRVNV